MVLGCNRQQSIAEISGCYIRANRVSLFVLVWYWFAVKTITLLSSYR
ncbi:hypothetical protein FDUTEX481_04167 [Tolypothrix sp. PCC 7601]|nr:hypothetical protein FDUTEX481_04167 [Tolypothrix sp. PCC 7601]